MSVVEKAARIFDGLLAQPKENILKGVAKGDGSMGSIATCKTPLAGGGALGWVAVVFVTAEPGRGELFAFEAEQMMERYLGDVKEKVFYHKRVDGSTEPCEHVGGR